MLEGRRLDLDFFLWLVGVRQPSRLNSALVTAGINKGLGSSKKLIAAWLHSGRSRSSLGTGSYRWVPITIRVPK